jgi:hypothetical protein
LSTSSRLLQAVMPKSANPNIARLAEYAAERTGVTGVDR